MAATSSTSDSLGYDRASSTGDRLSADRITEIAIDVDFEDPDDGDRDDSANVDFSRVDWTLEDVERWESSPPPSSATPRPDENEVVDRSVGVREQPRPLTTLVLIGAALLAGLLAVPDHPRKADDEAHVGLSASPQALAARAVLMTRTPATPPPTAPADTPAPELPAWKAAPPWPSSAATEPVTASESSPATEEASRRPDYGF